MPFSSVVIPKPGKIFQTTGKLTTAVRKSTGSFSCKETHKIFACLL